MFKYIAIAAVFFPAVAFATDHGHDPSGGNAYAGASATAGAVSISRGGTGIGVGGTGIGVGGIGGGAYSGGNQINGGVGNNSIPQPLMVLTTANAPGLTSGKCQGSASGVLWLLGGGKTFYDDQTCALELAAYANSIGRPDVAARLMCTNDQWKSVNKAECKDLLADKPKPVASAEPAAMPLHTQAAPLPLCRDVRDPNAACIQGY